MTERHVAWLISEYMQERLSPFGLEALCPRHKTDEVFTVPVRWPGNINPDYEAEFVVDQLEHPFEQTCDEPWVSHAEAHAWGILRAAWVDAKCR